MGTTNFKSFRWTSKREQAAALVAQGNLPIPRIAESVGVSSRAINWWKRRPEFVARVEEHVDATRVAVRDRAISDRAGRLDALQERWHLLQLLMCSRAREMKDVPGGETGLLVKRLRFTRVSGGRALQLQEVPDYQVDYQLLRELREMERQASMEMGQWGESNHRDGFAESLKRVLDDIGDEMGMSL
jgi:hypothetical protein